MPVPNITALPNNPSRIGDPTNFNTEVAVFLPTQPQFRTECNSVGAYLDTYAFDPFDWGSLSIAAPSKVSLSTFATPPIESDTGFVLTSKSDNTLQSMFNFVSEANSAGDSMDLIQSYVPSGSIITDELRPGAFGTVTDPPTFTDNQNTFNTKSYAFYNSVKSFADQFDAFYDYVYFRAIEPEDFGLITETPSETIDWGTF